MDKKTKIKSRTREISFEPDFRWTDITIIEADSKYAAVCEIMKNEPTPWCLRSDLTLVHPFGISLMTIEFFDDGRVVIVSCMPSTKDAASNFDTRCLTQWCGENGWKRPEPSKHVIMAMLDFWKHMWQVNTVDSSYLEERYGKRPEDVFLESDMAAKTE